MAADKENFSLKSYSDIFSSEAERTGSSVVVPIEMSLIDPFPNHPFHVCKDADMETLIQSIDDLGQLTPAIVRATGDGRYQMISGHRRMFALKALDKTTIQCQVLNISLDEATVLMVESNIYRPTITMSEKSFAYKMRFDAIKRMKEKLMLDQNFDGYAVPEYLKGDSRDISANDYGISRTQGMRLIRFTKLNDDLLKALDDGKLSQESAYNLSFLDSECMSQVVAEHEDGKKLPDKDVSLRLRDMSDNDELTPEKVHEVIHGDDKPVVNDKFEKFVLRGSEIRKHIPIWAEPDQLENFATDAFDLYVIFRESETFEEFLDQVKKPWIMAHQI